MSNSEMRESRRRLKRLGFTATKTRGGHWRFEHPDMDGPVFAPDTPSDSRGIKNF
jgi:predicted RNA binding protein YcfA (HicA-like mRNA interferase family)